MFFLEKTFFFEAAHQLIYHKGKCQNPHGHSYILVLHIQAENLIDEGSSQNMVMDFDEIAKIVQPMIEKYLDHKWLNETLDSQSPTVEFITKWIFDYLFPQIPKLYGTTLHETATCKASYFPFLNKDSIINCKNS